MNTSMDSGTQEMFEQLTFPMFQEQTVGRLEHLVKTSHLQGDEQDLTVREAALYERFLGFWKNSKKKINPHGLYMKTLRECCLATEDLTSSQSSLKWTDWGTMQNGKLSIQNGSFHKIGSEYTLLDIIEEEVENKCFLSKEQAAKIVLNL